MVLDFFRYFQKLCRLFIRLAQESFVFLSAILVCAFEFVRHSLEAALEVQRNFVARAQRHCVHFTGHAVKSIGYVVDVVVAGVGLRAIVEVPLRHGVAVGASPERGCRHLLAIIFSNMDGLHILDFDTIWKLRLIHVDLLMTCSANTEGVIVTGDI